MTQKKLRIGDEYMRYPDSPSKYYIVEIYGELCDLVDITSGQIGGSHRGITKNTMFGYLEPTGNSVPVHNGKITLNI